MPSPPVIPPQAPAVPPGSYLNPGGTGTFKFLDICKMSMVKIGAIDPTEQPDGQEASDVQAQANILVDSWNAARDYVYANIIYTGVISPNVQPHLIGPGGTANFNSQIVGGQSDGIIAQRPVKILRANLILQGNAAAPFINQASVRLNVRVHQDKGSWWMAKNAPGVASVTPTDLYYEEDFPLGKMYLWVVPTVAYPLELLLQTLLAQYQLADIVTLPQGGLMAFVYSLAEMIAPDFSLPWTAGLEQLKRAALRRFTRLNIATQPYGTRDAGIPGGKGNNGKRSDYNYISKQVND